MYDNYYHVPDSFYVDERTSTSRSYTLYHVKDPSISYELCTDDYQQALAWESADNDSRSANGYYVESYESDRYFEFIRELSFPDGIGNIGDLTSPGFARVFKSSYVNRDGVDRNLRDGYVVDWVFSVDKESGNLTKEFNLLFDLEAELINGVPTKCG